MTRFSSSSLRHCVTSSLLRFSPSSLRRFVAPSLLALLLVTSHSASAQEIIYGSFTWPDRGVRIIGDPNRPDSSAVVLALAGHEDGRLYVGGYFHYAGDLGLWTPGIAVWDGQDWIAIGCNDIVGKLVSHSSGVYAGGAFTQAGGIPANRIARWDGLAWHPLGAGTNAPVVAIEVQQGPEDDPAIVYAGGAFTQAGGIPANRIARWDGTAWSPLGQGCSSGVSSIAIYDDGSGSGSALYATGAFQMAGGIVVNKVAKWDFQSETWSPLGQGLAGGSGHALAVFPPPPAPGSELHVGGYFEEVDGQPIRGVARWNGQTWSAVGAGFNLDGDFVDVYSLKVLNDGHGAALYAAGIVDNTGFLMKWDGQSWTRYEPAPGALFDVEMYNGQLHVGGGLTEFVPKIARFTPDGGGFGCGDFDGDGIVTQADLGILLAAFDNCPGPNCPGDANGDGVVDQQDLGILLKHFGQPCG